MTTRIRKVFFERGNVSISIIETGEREKVQTASCLAFVARNKDSEDYWQVPANRIIRAKEILDMLKPSEFNIDSIKKLWKDMIQDPIDCEFLEKEFSGIGKSITGLFEELIKNKINPPIDELREILLSCSFNTASLSNYLEELLREGVGARMCRIASEPESKPKSNPWRKILPNRSHHS